MIDNKYHAIICDLGNVLIDFDHNLAVKQLLGHSPKMEEDIYDLFFDSPFTALYEEVKIKSDEFFGHIKVALALDMDYEVFLPIWNSIFFETAVNVKMHNFLRSIKNRYKLIMLSNINRSHFEFLNKKMSIFGEFDSLILSYEVGFRKPAPEIYRTALETAKLLPSEVFYIDDRKDLVEAASRLGIEGIVFSGEPAFERIREEIAA